MNSEIPLFFTGQGCENLDRLLSARHLDNFEFVSLKNQSIDQQIRELILQNTADPTELPEVVFGHSAGANNALEYVLQLKCCMPTQAPKRLVLLSPAPLPGMTLPWHITKAMMQKSKYAFKWLPWAAPFKLDLDYTNKLIFGSGDTQKEVIELFQETAGEWFPRVIAESALRGLDPKKKFFKWEDALAGVEVIVIGSPADNMITRDLSLKIATKLGATYRQWNSSHLGLLLGNNAEHYLEQLLDLAELAPVYA